MTRRWCDKFSLVDYCCLCDSIMVHVSRWPFNEINNNKKRCRMVKKKERRIASCHRCVLNTRSVCFFSFEYPALRSLHCEISFSLVSGDHLWCGNVLAANLFGPFTLSSRWHAQNQWIKQIFGIAVRRIFSFFYYFGTSDFILIVSFGWTRSQHQLIVNKTEKKSRERE